MRLVLVESPAKVKSLSRYLGPDYCVMATYGHVRDLPSKTGSVNPEDNFHLTFEVIERNLAKLKAIEKSAKKAHELILATDPDREGEAIAWHVYSYLADHNIKPKVSRITFNAITKKAVLEAVKTPRDIDDQLVDAYLARLSLDYLVGFNLSPVLWRKLPGCRSAGRVQSVALRILCDREAEIRVFKPQEYWTIQGIFEKGAVTLEAQLHRLEGGKLEKFTLSSEKEAQKALELANASPYKLAEIIKKRVSRNPAAPFSTSTLQQEAARKLGFSAVRTMRAAQQLYEGLEGVLDGAGLITYMRTDSTTMAPEAIQDVRKAIEGHYGKDFVAPDVRVYHKKARNAQEAHEAIRPTHIDVAPETLKDQLSADLRMLYDLIWRRAMASQMASALFDQVTYMLEHEEGKATFKTVGRTCVFKGFLGVYLEGKDQKDPDDELKNTLPILKEGALLDLKKLTPFQHFTEPPPRFSEASLIKKMEEVGIGRPSTYARILQVLKDRLYVVPQKKQLVPSAKGEIVSAFLVHFFTRYVEEDFTAQLEEKLDKVSRGEITWRAVLADFWSDFKPQVDGAGVIKTVDVLKTVENDLAAHFFKDAERGCPTCKQGKLNLRLGKFGPFLGCDRYPECRHMQSLDGEEGLKDEKAEGASEAQLTLPKVLGHDGERGLDMILKRGPYGTYIQWGEEGKKPKRVSIPKGRRLEDITAEEALRLGSLPKVLGVHPETKEEVKGHLGPYGPYVSHQGAFTSLKDVSLLFDGDFGAILKAMSLKKAKQAKKKKR